MERHLIGTISVVGMAIAAALLLVHAGSIAVDEGDALLPLTICGKGGGCDEVLNSRWAWFPPLPGENDIDASRNSSPLPGLTGGVRLPVALLGLSYFTLIALWMWMPAMAGFRFDRTLLALCSVGGMASLVFLAIMIRSIGAVCPLCLASHVINFFIFGLILKRCVSGPASASKANARAVSFAGLRRFAGVAATVLLIQGLLWHNLDLRKVNRATTSALRELQGDVEAMEMIYLGQKRQEVSVRDDSTQGLDAIEVDALLPASGSGYRNTIVVFGDVECAACRRFHDFLMNEVRPAHDGHLRVVFKHRPLDQIHPNARKAALALEAARRQGQFWELLDALYAEQGNLSNFDFSGAVRDLKMDPTQFVRDMSSPSAAQRIEEDEDLANRLGVAGAPAVFLNNRRVEKSILRVPGFWTRQVERLKRTRREAGQAWGNPDASASGDKVALGR
jgi:protein-disulfide isomerase/uncharacterized membrane protein